MKWNPEIQWVPIDRGVSQAHQRNTIINFLHSVLSTTANSTPVCISSVHGDWKAPRASSGSLPPRPHHEPEAGTHHHGGHLLGSGGLRDPPHPRCLLRQPHNPHHSRPPHDKIGIDALGARLSVHTQDPLLKPTPSMLESSGIQNDLDQKIMQIITSHISKSRVVSQLACFGLKMICYNIAQIFEHDGTRLMHAKTVVGAKAEYSSRLGHLSKNYSYRRRGDESTSCYRKNHPYFFDVSDSGLTSVSAIRRESRWTLMGRPDSQLCSALLCTLSCRWTWRILCRSRPSSRR